MILKLIAVGILTALFLIDDGSANLDALIDASRYPEAERNESIGESFKSIQIADPYRWLEDIDSEKTKKFIREETTLTEEYLKKSKYHDDIEARYAELWNIEKFDGPFRKGNKFFSYRGTDADKQDILYVHDEPIADGREFLDPNKLGDSVTLQKAGSAFSEDGKTFAYLTRESGRDSYTVQFKYLEEEDESMHKLINVNYPKVAWMKNDGIFYSSYGDFEDAVSDSSSSGNKIPKLYYHQLGTDQDHDIIVAELPNDYLVSSEISDDGVYLIVTASQGIKNLVYVANLDEIKYQIKGELELESVVSEMSAKYEFVTSVEKQFVFRTNEDAGNYKLVQVDVTKPGSWKNLVFHDNKRVLHWAKPASDKYIVLGYIAEDIRSVIQLYEIASAKIVMTFPLDIGTVKAESFYSDRKTNEIYFKFESFFTPGIIYHYTVSNPLSSKLEKIKEITVPNFDSSRYTAEFVTFHSNDNTSKISMHIVRKKEINFDGNNFTFMTANGGFGVSLLPYFSVNRIVILKNFDGMHVVSYIRGGGEKGEDWHKAGYQKNKQKSMNDFQAAAEYLIDKKYTTAKLLAVDGGAAGTSGPLIGASLNQRPDLFGAVIAEAGVMDMLRFDQFDIGREWISEYGLPKFDFAYLKTFSPLHNVKIDTIQYPATMLLTAAHDDRVPALHSLKFIATLQNEAKKKSIQKNPLLIKIEKSGTTSLEEAADITSFIVMNIGIEFKP